MKAGETRASESYSQSPQDWTQPVQVYLSAKSIIKLLSQAGVLTHTE